MNKKLIFFCISTAMIFLFSAAHAQSLGERIKRSACEKACERSYQKCMENSSKALDREKQGDYESDGKDAVKEETCQYTKESCLVKCE